MSGRSACIDRKIYRCKRLKQQHQKDCQQTPLPLLSIPSLPFADMSAETKAEEYPVDKGLGASASVHSLARGDNSGSANMSFGQRVSANIKHLGTRDAWLGDHDYAALFMPRWPYGRGKNLSFLERTEQPFYGLDDDVPIVLAAILGLAHCLAMLAGIITPPILISGYAYFDDATSTYLISASLITCSILSAIQMSRIPLGGHYQLGTGLLSVVGTSFATLSVSETVLEVLYSNGTCATVNGVRQACPEGYGSILGTAALCALLEIGLSFAPIKLIKKALPPMITGPVIVLIGTSLIQSSAFPNWGGGSGCNTTPATACFDPQGHLWGDARYIGLGFLSFITVVLIEIFGSPLMRSSAIVLGLLLPLVVAGPTGYISRSSIDASEPITFLWVHTFPLKIYAPAILPFLAVYLSLMAECIGDVTASAEVSRQSVTSKAFDKRLQGGVLSDGFGSLLAALFTITPVSVFAQNNGCIALTRCANRKAGYWACFWLFLFGVLGKIGGAIRAIPNSVLGGVTTILFASVVCSGLAVLSRIKYTRRTRFILTLSLGLGFGNLLVPAWFASVFTYSGTNEALQGFIDSIEIIVETPFLICAVTGIVANLILPMELEDRQVQMVLEEQARDEDMEEAGH